MGFDECGVLEAGRPADLCILDGGALHLHGADIASDIVYAACGADVRLTMVNGRVLYRDGEYTTIDAELMRALASSARKSLRK